MTLTHFNLIPATASQQIVTLFFFSAYGRVSSLNGEPEAGAVVRAMATADSGDCLSLGEEGLTENDGTFRIKGLRPGCNYDVTVRNKDDKFSRVAPEIFPLTVANDDFTDIRFIAFRPLTGFELSGYVITSNEFLPFIKVSSAQCLKIGFVLCQLTIQAWLSTKCSLGLLKYTFFFQNLEVTP